MLTVHEISGRDGIFPVSWKAAYCIKRLSRYELTRTDLHIELEKLDKELKRMSPRHMMTVFLGLVSIFHKRVIMTLQQASEILDFIRGFKNPRQPMLPASKREGRNQRNALNLDEISMSIANAALEGSSPLVYVPQRIGPPRRLQIGDEIGEEERLREGRAEKNRVLQDRAEDDEMRLGEAPNFLQDIEESYRSNGVFNPHAFSSKMRGGGEIFPREIFPHGVENEGDVGGLLEGLDVDISFVGNVEDEEVGELLTTPDTKSRDYGTGIYSICDNGEELREAHKRKLITKPCSLQELRQENNNTNGLLFSHSPEELLRKMVGVVSVMDLGIANCILRELGALYNERLPLNLEYISPPVRTIRKEGSGDGMHSGAFGERKTLSRGSGEVDPFHALLTSARHSSPIFPAGGGDFLFQDEIILPDLSPSVQHSSPHHPHSTNSMPSSNSSDFRNTFLSQYETYPHSARLQFNKGNEVAMTDSTYQTLHLLEKEKENTGKKNMEFPQMLRGKSKLQGIRAFRDFLDLGQNGLIELKQKVLCGPIFIKLLIKQQAMDGRRALELYIVYIVYLGALG